MYVKRKLDEWLIPLRRQHADKYPVSDSLETEAPGREYCVNNSIYDYSLGGGLCVKDVLGRLRSCFDFQSSRLGGCKHM